MPFGSAPRFEASVLRSAPFTQNPFDATYFGQACLQVLTQNTTYGVEDCLVMNVWSPRGATRESKLPVLVYIYGGSNDFGEAEPYNASQLAVGQNAVIASFNYRVGPYGFLAFQEQIDANKTSGNYALLDIQTALRWVKREISAFGGDPDQVGIFGQSSGAGLVELQTVIPSSGGLFGSAISQSGGLGAGSLSGALRNSRIMAERLNCSTRGFKSNLTCLKQTSGDLIIFAQGTQCITPNDCVGLNFGPIVDGVLLPESPEKLVSQGRVNDVSILYGANTNDSNLFISSEYGPWNPLNKSSYEKKVADMFYGPRKEELTRKALEMYPPRPRPEENNGPVLGWLMSDQTLCDLRSSVDSYSAVKGREGRNFAYRYNWWFQSNKICTAVPNYHPPEFGSLHQDEVSFVFGQPIKMNLGYTNCSDPGWPGYDPSCRDCIFDAKEQSFAETMGRFWTNMASSGNPNRRKGEAAPAVEAWPAYDRESKKNIVLKPVRAPYTPETMQVETFVGREAVCKFWDSV